MMKCCKFLVDGSYERLPFERAIATGYYDGPTDGFTICSQCGQAYSFRKLDWDELQDVRVFAFAPISIKFDVIFKQYAGDSDDQNTVVLARTLTEAESEFVRQLFTIPPTRVTTFEGWPGHSSSWRDVTGLNLDSIDNWFSFLRIPKRHA
jgi:hypothetical protein